MGTSYYIVGYKKDEKFEKMFRIKILCDELNMTYPKELSDYFSDSLLECDWQIEYDMTKIKIPHEKFVDACMYGIDVLVKDIPKECKKIKFVVSQ